MLKHLLSFFKTTSPLTTAELSTAQESYTFWISNGFTPTQAVGLMANEEAECSFNWKAIGDNDTAYGIVQWHWDRGAVILNGCGIDVRSADHLDQLKAELWELNNPEKAALKKLLVTTTPEDAASAVCVYYERSGLADQPAARAAKATVLATLFIPAELRAPKQTARKKRKIHVKKATVVKEAKRPRKT